MSLPKKTMHENLFFLNYTPFFKLAMHTSMDKLAKEEWKWRTLHLLTVQEGRGQVITCKSIQTPNTITAL